MSNHNVIASLVDATIKNEGSLIDTAQIQGIDRCPTLLLSGACELAMNLALFRDGIGPLTDVCDSISCVWLDMCLVIMTQGYESAKSLLYTVLQYDAAKALADSYTVAGCISDAIKTALCVAMVLEDESMAKSDKTESIVSKLMVSLSMLIISLGLEMADIWPWIEDIISESSGELDKIDVEIMEGKLYA